MTRYMFEAIGTPVPEGSTRAFMVNGRPVITHVGAPKLTEWRDIIGWSARESIKEVHQGAIRIEAVFWMLRPPSVSAKKRPDMTVKPDIDKLARALLDSLTGIAYRDDSQVVKLTVDKRYCDTSLNQQPGVAVTVLAED